jgi:exonuclease SbcC
MITLKSIKLYDFLSHEKTIIHFKPEDKILLAGDSGSGKSGILEGIIWALFGRARSDNRSVVRRGAEGTTATVELELLRAGSESISITRMASTSGKHTVSVKINGVAHTVSGLRETQSWIENELIGASYTLFTNSLF